MARKKDGVFLRPDSRYWQLRYTDRATGTYIRMSSDTTIKEKAQELLDAKVHNSWDCKNLGAPVIWTVREVVEWAWNDHWSLRPTSDKIHLFQLLKAPLGSLGGLLARDLTVSLVHEYIKVRRAKVRLSTINREMAPLRSAFNLAIKAKYLRENPFADVLVFDENEFQRHRNANLTEKRMLVENSAGLLHDIIEFAFDTGLRKGQIEALKWSDVDLETGRMRIETRKGKKQRVYVYYVPIFDLARTVLERRPRLSEWVFCNEMGEKIPRAGIIHASFPRLVDRLEIHDLHFHDIRHTFGTQYYRHTKDLVAICYILGHTDIKTTKRYLNLTPEDLVPASGGNIWVKSNTNLTRSENGILKSVENA